HYGVIAQGTVSVSTSTFAGGDAGIMVYPSSTATLIDDDFDSGSLGIRALGGSTVTATGTRFGPALDYGLSNEGATVTAANDWWGCNGGANASGCARTYDPGRATVVEPHLVLSGAADPSSVPAG